MEKLLAIFVLLVAMLHHASAVDYGYNQQAECMNVHWTLDEKCGVLTPSNTEIIHWTTDGGSSNCTLSAYGWALTPNAQYYAYYPYSQSYKTNHNPMTALPVSFLGQSQTENGSTAHLAAFDFMTAQAKSTEEACHFTFAHLGSLLRIECEIEGKRNLRQLMLTSEQKDFATDGTMNVVDGKFTPTTYDETMPLMLNDIPIADGEKLVAYMMVPPINLTGRTLTLKLIDTDGVTSEAELKGTTIQQGYFYPITLKMPKFGAVAKARPANRMIKASPPQRAASIVQTVTAFVPDFALDNDHRFEQINIPEEETSRITNHKANLSKQKPSYTISGIKTAVPAKGTIFIRSGKKYLIK